MRLDGRTVSETSMGRRVRPDRVVPLDTFSAADPLEQVREFQTAFRAHENPDRLTDDFLGRIPVDTFGPTVPAEDRTLQILGEDGIV
jgi:hypothetical protein